MPTQRIAFKDWLPDQPSILDTVSEANNVIPLAVGYGAFKSAVNYSASASEDLTNVFAGKIDNDVTLFAGGLTKLFKLDSTSLALDNVSKSAARTISNVALTSNVATITTASAHKYSTGDSVTVDASNNVFDGTYVITATPTATTFTYAKVNANITSAAATGTVIAPNYTSIYRWQFIQFGNYAIATNGSEKVQYYDVTSSSYFGDLAATAPVAKFVTVVRDFVVCANIGAGTNPARVTWSDINDSQDWTAGAASQSDFQELPDGGDITGIVGGEFGIVFLEKAIVRMSYIGSPLFFQFDTISRNVGCIEGGSVAQYSGVTYFLADDGFYSCNGQQVTPIGAEKIDRFFFNNANIGDIDSISSSIDPERNLVIWNYTNVSGARELLIYNFQTQKWCSADTDVDYLGTLATTGTSLEGIDTAYNTTAGSFVATKQYTIRSVGTTDYTLIGAVANTVGVLFTATGVGSGTGVAIDMAASAAALKTIDTLVTTMDDRLYKGGKFIFGGVRDAKIITFTGTNATASITTNDLEYGYNSVLTLIRPSVDNGSASVSVASRRMLDDTITFGSSVSASEEDRCAVRSAGRYHRVNFVPTGANWFSAIGMDIDYSEQGTR
jgi:hypothetical protein